MLTTLAVIGLLALAVPVVFLCAGVHQPGIRFVSFLRKTFAPMTMRDFLLPPCPACWAIRVVALALIVYSMIAFTDWV